MKAKFAHFVIGKNRFWTILVAILLFSLITKVIRLGEPSDFYFDEVYHGFTATYYLNGHSDSYSLYHKNPPGRAVEWTHPPLAKLFMAAGMWVFGENSFGWRISSVLLGTAMILFAALLARELFASEFISLLSAFFLSIEGLVFTQSRIAMNDAHLMCFVYMCFYFYVRWRNDESVKRHLYLAGVGLGLALACKWSALFIYFIIALDRLAIWFIGIRRPTNGELGFLMGAAALALAAGGGMVALGVAALIGFLYGLVWIPATQRPSLKELFTMTLALIVVPGLVYLASYGHFFWLGYTWEQLISLQKQMWWYHTNLKATHPYMSKPYHWIFNLKPVWMYVDYSVPGYVGNIYNTGNSILLYLGLASTLITAQELWKKMNWQLWFCLSAYFMVWVPWSFSPRIMLFYHYAPAVPMLCILLSRQLEKAWYENYRKSVMAVIGLATIWFGVFYPNHTGVPVQREFVDAIYHALPGWK